MIQQLPITGVDNPNYGADVAEVWWEIRNNPDITDSAWAEISREVSMFDSAVSYMRRLLDPLAEDPFKQSMSDNEEEDLWADERALRDTVFQIALEVEKITGVSFLPIEDTPIERSVWSGLQFASLLLREFVPEPELVGEFS